MVSINVWDCLREMEKMGDKHNLLPTVTKDDMRQLENTGRYQEINLSTTNEGWRLTIYGVGDMESSRTICLDIPTDRAGSLTLSLAKGGRVAVTTLQINELRGFAG